MNKPPPFLFLGIVLVVILSATLGVLFSYHGLRGQSTAFFVGENWRNKADRVFLTVNGEPITERWWTTAYDNVRLNPKNAQMPEEEAKVAALHSILRQAVLYTEALKKGFLVSEEEAKSFAEEQRKLLEAPEADPEGKEFLKELLKGMGITEEEYWSQMALASYRVTLTINRLKDSLRQSLPAPIPEEVQDFKSRHPEFKDAPQGILEHGLLKEKFQQFWDNFTEQLTSQAKIEVIDPQFSDLLPKALSP